MSAVPLVPVCDTFSEKILDRLDVKRYVFITPIVVFINSLVSDIILPVQSLQVAQHQTSFIIIPNNIRRLMIILTQLGS